MCGIFAYFLFGKNSISDNYKKILLERSSKISHRGPDHRECVEYSSNNKYYSMMDFHRLCINDLTDHGTQPMELDGIYLMTNGEIYNYKKIYDSITDLSSDYVLNLARKYKPSKNKILTTKYEGVMSSHSDCEVILHLYKYLVHDIGLHLNDAINELFSVLDGVFATVIHDTNKNMIIAGSDPVGVRSLFWKREENELCFCSEYKGLIDGDKNYGRFQPGTFWIINVGNYEYRNKINITEHTYGVYPSVSLMNHGSSYELMLKNINMLLEKAVEKRLMSDRRIGCLLSGGLDSSLVASIIVKLLKKKDNFDTKQLMTFSVGLKDSPDLVYAKKVADMLGTDHHEVIVTVEDMINAIPEVVRVTETYDITTIRASVPNYLLSKYIKENTDVTVIFSGEGADEIFGGYLYFDLAPNFREFQKETYNRVEKLHMYDVLRCDKTTASQSLEVRVPFLDKTFMNYVMQIDPYFKMTRKDGSDLPNSKVGKHLLRNAFDNEYTYLPHDVLWRQKDAFSDAVGYNWVSKIKEFTDEMYMEEFKQNNNYKYNKPETTESYYYRKLFHEYYGDKNVELLIGEIWRPRWTNERDPSATLLEHHKGTEN
jgi:asparagine synthase (glutamine-hydrolysing)